MYQPKNMVFSTPIRIQKRVETSVSGTPRIEYLDVISPIDYCSWKGKGGTESVESGSLIIEETAELTMWYRPDVTRKGRVILEDNPEMVYEILDVENVEMRSHYMILKVKRVVSA